VNGVLIDTSVWVAHFRRADSALQSLLDRDQALCHPLIVIEIACGSPPSPRIRTLADLRMLRQTTVATSFEVLGMIERERPADSGCGAVDAALLASTLLTPGTKLWTTDKPLAALARRNGVAFEP
jgi:predicted nucleic acid-binding protein